MEQEEFQSRRLITEAEKEGKEFVSSLRQEIEAERGKQTQARQNLLARLQEVKQLEIDSFFVVCVPLLLSIRLNKKEIYTYILFTLFTHTHIYIYILLDVIYN